MSKKDQPIMSPSATENTTTSSSSSSSSSEMSNAEPLESPEEALSRCLLSQYRFCIGGVGLGTAYAVQTKGTKGYGLLPMVFGGIAGSAADLVYGYTVACLPERERYQQHRMKNAAKTAADAANSSKNNQTAMASSSTK